jgi:hypothetical protein
MLVASRSDSLGETMKRIVSGIARVGAGATKCGILPPGEPARG